MAPSVTAFRFRAVWLAIGYALVALTAWGSLTPQPPHVVFTVGDKIIHAGTYGLLTYWFGQLYPAWRAQAGIVLAFTALGIALEFAQAYWSVFRHFDWFDAGASAVGALVGWALLQTRAGRALACLDARLARFA